MWENSQWLKESIMWVITEIIILLKTSLVPLTFSHLLIGKITKSKIDFKIALVFTSMYRKETKNIQNSLHDQTKNIELYKDTKITQNIHECFCCILINSTLFDVEQKFTWSFLCLST